jgi:hypothetical protein
MQNLKVIINRVYTDKETMGNGYVLTDDSLLFSFKTLELPWLNNQHNISCIPEGNYDVVKYTSAKLGNVFWIPDVPDRTGILIHPGTFANGNKINTEGCILVGAGYQDLDGNGTLDIIDSRKTLDRLLGILPDRFKLYII